MSTTYQKKILKLLLTMSLGAAPLVHASDSLTIYNVDDTNFTSPLSSLTVGNNTYRALLDLTGTFGSDEPIEKLYADPACFGGGLLEGFTRTEEVNKFWFYISKDDSRSSLSIFFPKNFISGLKHSKIVKDSNEISIDIPINEPLASMNWGHIGQMVLGETYTVILDLGDGNNYDLSNFPVPSVMGGSVSGFQPVPGSSTQYTTLFIPDGSSNIASINFAASVFQDVTGQFFSPNIGVDEVQVLQPNPSLYFNNAAAALTVGQSYQVILDLGAGNTYAVNNVIPSHVLGGSVDVFEPVAGSMSQYVANFIPDGTSQNVFIQFSEGTFTSGNGMFTSLAIEATTEIIQPTITFSFDNNPTYLSVNATYPVTLDLGKGCNYLQLDPHAIFPEIFITSGDVSNFQQDADNNWVYHAKFTPTTKNPYQLMFPTGSFFSEGATFVSPEISLPTLPVYNVLSVALEPVMNIQKIGSYIWDIAFKSNNKLAQEPIANDFINNAQITWRDASGNSVEILPEEIGRAHV